MNRKARRAAAKQAKTAIPDSRVVAPANSGRDVGSLFALAVQHHQAGRFSDAEGLYRQVLACDSNHAESLHLLGAIAHQNSRHEAAIDLIGRAIALDPRSPQFHYNIGLAFAALGRIDEAIRHNRSAIELRSDYADAHNNLAAALRAKGQLSEAAAHYQRALALKPGVLETYDDLARVLLAEGDAEAALEVVRRGFSVRETPSNRHLFVQCMKHLRSIPRGGDLRDLLIRALLEPWGRSAELARIGAAFLKQSDIIGACVARANAAWPRLLSAQELFGSSGLSRIAGDRLFRCLLEFTVVRDIPLERFLTNARRAVLVRAIETQASDALDPDLLNVACALARQCFINEYVFGESEGEREQVGALRDALVTALQSGGPIPALWPVAVASYMALHSISGADALLDMAWPEVVAGVLVQQVQEPKAEQQLRASIPLLTPIADRVSVLVKRQYEENPYPRWPEPMPPSKPLSFDDYMCLQFPLAPFQRLGKANVDILIAGCGTGRQSISTAQNIVGAQVLAIDLSLTSLGYAKRKTLALGLGNIEYAQADILQLGSIGRTFDVIEAGGVLHHLADPWAGWRMLLALLRPNGCMRIGLYSALARPAVVAARRFIAERGYGPSANDIRKCRQELMNLRDGAPLKILTDSSDFFHLSGCRDLMFHVQEHQVTLPAIKSFLIENDLQFLGFVEMDAGTIREYRRRFPADNAMIDLDLWHLFETEHPHTFAGMYMFAVQKRSQSDIASD